MENFEIFEKFTRRELANRVVLLNDVPENSVLIRKPSSDPGTKEFVPVTLTEGKYLGMKNGNVVIIDQPNSVTIKYDQAEEVTTWTVTHNKDNPNVVVAVYNSDGEHVLPNSVVTTANTVEINFLAPMSGKAFLTFVL